MNIFTKDQKVRMRQTLTTSPNRISLWYSTVSCAGITNISNYIDTLANSHVCTPTGVLNAFQPARTFTFSPNPANDILEINIASPETLFMYNYLGIKVSETELNTTQNYISIANLPRGIYFLKIKNQIEKVILY
jgi:hypothetical protein